MIHKEAVSVAVDRGPLQSLCFSFPSLHHCNPLVPIIIPNRYFLLHHIAPIIDGERHSMIQILSNVLVLLRASRLIP
jgi:hypothetical protein